MPIRIYEHTYQLIIIIILNIIGYASKPCLFTPLLNPVTESKIKFNKTQIKIRIIIERVFSVWKRHFPCLRRGLANSQQITVSIIIACAVICIYLTDQGIPKPQVNYKVENTRRSKKCNIYIIFV